MKINKKNYFSIKNQYLSNSRLGDFLKCKRFFFELHIAGTKKKEKAPKHQGRAEPQSTIDRIYPVIHIYPAHDHSQEEAWDSTRNEF